MTRAETIARIQKLQRFTTQNGCTEAEATRAIEAIARLMAEHQLSEAELRTEQSSCRDGSDGFVGPAEWAITTVGIGHLFSVIIYTEPYTVDLGDGLGCLEGKKLHAFGYPTDVEAALAMAQLCFTAIATECETWRKHNRGNTHSFRIGMAERLNQRILDLIPRSTSTALVPLKKALVKQEFVKTGVQLRNVTRNTARDQNAYAAGVSAANRVALSREARLGQTRRIT